jgi:hypothetical protein
MLSHQTVPGPKSDLFPIPQVLRTLWLVLLKPRIVPARARKSAHIAALTGIALVHHRKKLGMPLGSEFDEKNFTEIYVDANRPFIFEMEWWLGSYYIGSSCGVTKVFEPKENQMYEASFILALMDA